MLASLSVGLSPPFRMLFTNFEKICKLKIDVLLQIVKLLPYPRCCALSCADIQYMG